MKDDTVEAKMIAKYLFIHHEHPDKGKSGIYYKEKVVVELLKLLGHPEPDWNWYKTDEEWLEKKKQVLEKKEIK